MIKEGSKVKVHYTGKLESNEVFDTSNDKEPLEFTVGEGQLIPGFEKGVMGMNTGDKKTINIKPNEAYGEIREDLLNEVEKERIPQGVTAGQTLQAQTPNGPVNVLVKEVKENSVVIDANHPLAGKNLIFELEVVEVV